jgi:hypothetical protein
MISSLLVIAGFGLHIGLHRSSGAHLANAGAQTREKPLFQEVAAQVGLNFRHFTGATGEFYMPEIMGSGIALFDFDGDADLDVYLPQGTLLDTTRRPADALFPPPAGQPRGHRLFRNDLKPGGKLSFVDVTVQAGVERDAYGMGVAVADYDNDGDLDLYVTNFGPNVLYRNNGNGTFTDVTREAGVDDERWSSSAAFLDYDRDGDLDLFVANYIDFTIKGNRKCFATTGERDYCTPSIYRPVPSRLFRNEGSGKFVDATGTAGIGNAFGPGLGVASADFNGDGWLDIYVANDGAANILWINKKDGTFEESALLSGVAYAADGVARAGMGVGCGDFDNDGDEDVLVTNLRREGSTLYRNDGKGLFHDASAEFGLAHTSFLSTGFGTGWFDYDHDGRLDLFTANGAVTLLETLKGTPYPFTQRNQLFHNEGENRKFLEVTTAAGPALALLEVGRGAAFGDIDNDGDIDIVVSNNNGPVRLLRNEAGSGNHWLQVRLEGVKDNRNGLGARIAVLRKEMPALWRRCSTDGSYLTASDARVHFGLGKVAAIEAVEVYWLNGDREVWRDIKVNASVTLRQGSGKTVTPQ